mgnify:FL=1
MSDQKNITTTESKTPERVSKRPVISPAVDIFENTEEIVVVADVPGTGTEGLNVHFDKDQLFIEASATAETAEHNPLFREFSSYDYRRVFELAPGIDIEAIKAELTNGVLTIHLPKSAAIKPRRIQVTSE